VSAVLDPLAVEGLKVSLGRREVLHGVNLVIRRGELVVVVGPNGAGKTTLLKAVIGLLPASGAVAIDGIPLPKLPLAERARRVAYLPQGHMFHWPLAVEDVVALGRLPRNAGVGLSAADHAAIRRAMEATGIAEYAKRPVTTLSGGERARVALARVLATEARLILADEPTASLDPHYQLVVLDILRRHVKGGGAAVAVLHDLSLAARRADRIVIMDKGVIVADGSPRAVLTKPRLAETFGVNAQIVTLVDAPVVIPWTVT
jgi:iron complex transport system ATP-binding protein